MSILNIFNGKKAENSEKEQTIIVNNKENVLKFKADIAELVKKQKGNRAVTRKPHNSDTWTYQNAERELKYELFVKYTAYYIVKHYLWLEENKEKCEEYLNKVIENAKRALHSNEQWLQKHLIEKFRRDVQQYVGIYTTE
jgi:23S rRNA maturation mini-RNase III